MTKEGKKAFLEAIRNGKGFVGFHCAADTFHSSGERGESQPVNQRDPYINMLGGEFIVHGSQQSTTMTVADPKFPGAGSLGPTFTMHEEWYSLKDFSENLHVLLMQETEGMKGSMYERPAYPATWIREQGKGHVFYTSMGHRDDIWTNPIFQDLLIGGIRYALGDVKADATPNLQMVAPGWDKNPNYAPQKDKPAAPVN